MDLFTLVPIVFVLAGLGTAAGAVVSVVRHRRFVARAERAEGEVVGLVPRSQRVRSGSSLSSGVSASYRTVVTQTPVVAFRTRAGEDVRVEVSRGSARYGERVEVAYDPERPTSVVVADAGVGAALARVGFGLLFALFGLLFLRTTRDLGGLGSP